MKVKEWLRIIRRTKAESNKRAWYVKYINRLAKRMGEKKDVNFVNRINVESKRVVEPEED